MKLLLENWREYLNEDVDHSAAKAKYDKERWDRRLKLKNILPTEIEDVTCPDCECFINGEWRTGICDICQGGGDEQEVSCENCEGTGAPICCRCEGTGVDPESEDPLAKQVHTK